MSSIIARTYMGARDLYNGIPNLIGAVVKEVVMGDKEDFETTIIFEDKRGNEHSITIKQES